VRRGSEWVVKAAQGGIVISPAEAEATGWLLARPDVTVAELTVAAPGVDAAALLGRLTAAGLLAPSA
jgi:hypothetical protein